MLTVTVVREFNDEREGVLRKVEDIFSCSEDRLAEINGAGYGVMVEEAPKPKKRPRKEEPQEQ